MKKMLLTVVDGLLWLTKDEVVITGILAALVLAMVFGHH
jgi:hypothetical protein